jgi:hypothetical protein
MSGIEHDIPDLGVTITNDLQTTRVVVEKDPYLGVDVANDLQTKRVIVRQQSYIINQNSIPIPEGIAISAVSSSYAQTASLANLAVTASFALSNAGTVQNATSASYATTASYVSGAASTWDDISNKPEGLVSSSTQIINYNLLATTGSNIFTGTQIAPSFSGSLFGTASWAQYAVTASYVEGPAGITDWSEITNKPDGLVSSSAQINTGSFSGSFIGDGSGLTNIASTLTFSGSTGGDVLNLKTETLNILGSNGITTSITDNTVTVNLPAGTVTASSQIDYTQIQNQPTVIPSASYVEYSNVANKPTLVSSSAQINTGSFSGSFTGQLIGTSSWATNAISASYASNAELLDGLNSTVFATTGSNTFNGNQTISGSVFANIDTLILTGSMSILGTLSVSDTITGSLFGTASYAVTASYIDGGYY